MGNLRISSEFEGVRYVDDNGMEHTPQPEPFQVQTLLGKWKPICIRHKLLFKGRQQYDNHWTPVCNNYDYKDCPPSDLAVNLKGYSKP